MLHYTPGQRAHAGHGLVATVTYTGGGGGMRGSVGGWVGQAEEPRLPFQPPPPGNGKPWPDPIACVAQPPGRAAMCRP